MENIPWSIHYVKFGLQEDFNILRKQMCKACKLRQKVIELLVDTVIRKSAIGARKKFSPISRYYRISQKVLDRQSYRTVTVST
jgi:hypothetical protein